MTWSFQKSYSNKVCLTVSADLVSCNLTLSLFFTFPNRTKGETAEYPRSVAHFTNHTVVVITQKAYVVFVRIPPLLDILNSYFLHGAPWHDVPFFLRIRWKKSRYPCRVFFERSHPAEKVYTATLLCHPNGWDRSEQTPFFLPVKLPTSKFPVQHSDSRKPEVNNRFFLSPPFSCLVPTRWLPRPNSQPIPARLLPFEQLGRFVDQPSSFRAKPQSAGTLGLQSAHLELDVRL